MPGNQDSDMTPEELAARVAEVRARSLAAKRDSIGSRNSSIERMGKAYYEPYRLTASGVGTIEITI